MYSFFITEWSCNKPGFDQSKDQRIQHEVHRTPPCAHSQYCRIPPIKTMLICVYVSFSTFCWSAHLAAGLSPHPKPPANHLASSKPSWDLKKARSTAPIRLEQERSGGDWKVNWKVLLFSVVIGYVTSDWTFISVCVPWQMTPVHRGIEVLGKLALQGSWGSPLKRKLQLVSPLVSGLMIVLLHRLTGWVFMFLK